MHRPVLPENTRIEVEEYADGSRKYYPQFCHKGLFFTKWFYFFEDNEMCEGTHRVCHNSSIRATKFLQQQTLVKTTYLEPQL